MAESPDWRQRLQEARQRMVFEPTPTGATPYVVTLERAAEALDAVEVAAAASSPTSPAATLATAVALLLREHINTRQREAQMRARFETTPDRTDALLTRVEQLLAKLESSNG